MSQVTSVLESTILCFKTKSLLNAETLITCLAKCQKVIELAKIERKHLKNREYIVIYNVNHAVVV